MQDENKIVAMRYNAKLGEWVEVKKVNRVRYRNGKCVDCGAVKGAELKLSCYYLSTEQLEERLESICPCLEKLDLGSTNISDDGLKHIAGLVNLNELNLCYTNISDAGLKHIAGLVNLTQLDLGFTKISNAGLKHIAELINLKELDLDYTKISDAGLKDITGLVNLTELSLWNTKISDAGQQAFRKLIAQRVAKAQEN